MAVIQEPTVYPGDRKLGGAGVALRGKAGRMVPYAAGFQDLYSRILMDRTAEPAFRTPPASNMIRIRTFGSPATGKRVAYS